MGGKHDLPLGGFDREGFGLGVSGDRELRGSVRESRRSISSPGGRPTHTLHIRMGICAGKNKAAHSVTN